MNAIWTSETPLKELEAMSRLRKPLEPEDHLELLEEMARVRIWRGSAKTAREIALSLRCPVSVAGLDWPPLEVVSLMSLEVIFGYDRPPA